MPKKKTALTIEERLQQALVPAEEQPYEVPENWVWVRLGAFAEAISKGTTPKGGSAAYVDEGVNFLRVENLTSDGYISHSKITHITEEMHENYLKRSILKANDLLISIAGSLGKSAIVRECDLPINTNQAIAFVRLFADKIDVNYIRNTIESPLINSVLTKQTKVTSIPNLTLEIIKDCPIPLPPLSEQQRIVERIEELFAKLDEAKERLQEVADSFAVRKAAILHKAFTGELTKQWRRENGVSDESWEEKKGEDFFEYVTSGSRGWAKYYSDKGSIFVRMGNLNHGTIELDFSDIQYVELPDQVEGQRSKLQKNDILISITADVGMIGLVREDMDAYINQHVALARPKDNLYAEFLAWYFVSDVGLKQMQNKQRGATKIGLGLKDIRSIILKIPSLPEQHEIVRLIDDLLARERAAQQAAEQALASIDLMKKSILARAFRGELGTNKASEASALELLKQVLAEN
ncbi:restriction endonuclease subunit S [uncultured Phascolarctobacterium sp.]|uniref:restriction endonuclease subunit S n=1 Tax=uncultured Phascolarctobacterium sp. TaxID=512296 RepID=UPI0025E64E11|nr:restriction endonuclease subunit S [uncultured Phascolarctobacterium sp.]